MIAPYVKPPKQPTIALLTDCARMLTEDGRDLPLEAADSSCRIYGSHELVAELLYAQRGEALAWNGEPVRYRLSSPDPPGEWVPRPSDVRILRIPCPSEPERMLRGLIRWRDWLAAYGAAPGSLGQASWSLLRATIARRLWTSGGERPPIRWTMGGRIELRAERGHYEGDLRQFDLQAAYARTLGTLAYGGRWKRLGQDTRLLEVWQPFSWPTFVRAEVRIPPLQIGPLPRRPRARQTAWDSVLSPTPYPTGVRMRGVWTLEEVEEAEAAGCKVRRLETWLHIPAIDGEAGDFWHPFARWWAAIEEGRAMRGFAGLLAKVTGNALFGQLCMSDGSRTIVRVAKGGRKRVKEPAPVKGSRPAAHDLTETVSGRVRALLAAFLRQAGPRALCAHTDGAWCLLEGCWQAPYGWREKERASWLRLLSPQALAYLRRGESEPTYVFAGIPLTRSERVFRDYWAFAYSDQFSELGNSLSTPLLEGGG